MAAYHNIKLPLITHTYLRVGNSMKLLDCSPPISIDEIRLFESNYSLELPKEFVVFYLSYNGGLPEKDKVRDGKCVFPVHQFDDFSEINRFKKGLDEYSVPKELDYVRTIPFAYDQGGNTYALYYDQKAPKVYFYTTSDEMTIHGEWSSFSTFLESFFKS